MCTAICDGALFGRTLDLECSFSESVVITPRNFAFSFLYEGVCPRHYAMIGTAHVAGGVPLYYDAMNERGLCAAALNFPAYAHYGKPKKEGYNIASFELIPWLLTSLATVKEVRELLAATTLTEDSFSEELKTTPLHFMISDREQSIVVEPLPSGLRIHENPFGVMTNSPPFDHQTAYLHNFLSLSSVPPENKLCPSVSLPPYSRGMGAVGLPGDFSSPSRFVRAVYSKSHATKRGGKREEINRFFHIFDTVSVPLGCVKAENGEDVFTVYTSCADMETLIYRFTTYENREIRSVRLAGASLDGNKLSIFSMSAQ